MKKVKYSEEQIIGIYALPFIYGCVLISYIILVLRALN
jgi:hypothetical protein